MPIASRIPHLYKVNYIVRDGFNRADSSSLGNAETGQAWTGNMQIVSGTCRASVDGVAVTRVDAGTPHVEVSCLVRSLANFNYLIGPAARIQDQNNCWILKLARGAGRFQLVKRQAGADIVIAQTGAIIVDNVTYRLRLVCAGNTISAYYDDKLIGSTTDTFNNTVTVVGFYQEGDVFDATTPRVWLDDFVVRPA